MSKKKYAGPFIWAEETYEETLKKFNNLDKQRKKMRINSRQKGKAYELKLMGELKEHFPNIKTSRNASKLIDDMKVDFVNTEPYVIQAKATERAPNLGLLLQEMKKNFPDLMPLVAHKKNYHPETISLLKKDFYYILKLLRKHGEI